MKPIFMNDPNLPQGINSADTEAVVSVTLDGTDRAVVAGMLTTSTIIEAFTAENGALTVTKEVVTIAADGTTAVAGFTAGKTLVSAFVAGADESSVTDITAGVTPGTGELIFASNFEEQAAITYYSQAATAVTDVSGSTTAQNGFVKVTGGAGKKAIVAYSNPA